MIFPIQVISMSKLLTDVHNIKCVSIIFEAAGFVHWKRKKQDTVNQNCELKKSKHVKSLTPLDLIHTCDMIKLL